MSEAHILFLFCVVYSGALSVAVWTNMLVQKRLKAHLKNEDFFADFNR
jgi:hypothetical protein